MLYNSSLPEYMDKNKKQQAIREIANEFGLDETIVTKKMGSLRSYYCNLRNTCNRSKQSGSGATQVKTPTWPFFNSMSFLDDYTPLHSQTYHPRAMVYLVRGVLLVEARLQRKDFMKSNLS